MNKLREHVAIVTGATRGIGKAIAIALGKEGANIVLAARSERDLNRIGEELSKQEISTLVLPTDITIEGQVESLVQKTIDRFHRIDILVNNAGVGFFGSVVEMGVSDFDTMWNVNMRGAFLATKTVLPHMIRAESGTIVNIASLAGKNSLKNGAGYAATKWALRGFASSVMLEVREYNIRVTTIFPGSVDTSFSMMNKRGESITQPEDVASAVVFAVTAPARAMFSEIDVRPTIPK